MEIKLFKKNKLSVAIALTTGALMLSACSEEDSISVVEDSSRFEVIEQATPTADIFGVVQDTNGNPIPGAVASIGGIQAVTDATGAYRLYNVPVTGFTSTMYLNENGNGAIPGGATGSVLQISVKTPADYLNATVTVTPVAGSNLVAIAGFNNNASGEADLEAENSLMSIILTDGLAVGAGVTVVPETEATVKGVLRDATTGLPIADTVVALELVGVAAVNQQQTHNGTGSTAIGYSSMPYAATTDSNGAFRIENVPEDAEFNIFVEDWSTTAVSFVGNGNIGSPALGGNLTTTPEVTVQNLGDVMVSPTFSVDTVAPFVTRVDGVVTNAGRAILNDDLDGTQGIVIHFNEPLSNLIDANSVYIIERTSGTNQLIPVSSSALSADGMSLTVTSAVAIAEGTMFDIMLQVADFEDASENGLVTGPFSYLGVTLPFYDINPAVSTGTFVGLQLQTHQEPITSTAAVSNLTQVMTDPLGMDNFPILKSINSNFTDVDFTATAGIRQLNDASDGGVTGSRLNSLASAILGGAGIPASVESTPSVEVDRARVKFDISTATTYVLSLTDANGVPQTFTSGNISFVGLNQTGLSKATLSGTTASITVNPAAFNGPTVEILLDNVSPNDVLTVASTGTFGTVDATSTLTLVDHVSPTTVVQNSYGLGVSANGDTEVNVDYGDGGELSSLGAGNFGTPYLNVTPYLLTPQTAKGLPLQRSETWDTLTDLFTANITNGSSGELEMDISSNLAGMTPYNAAAISGWTPGSRTVGVAFSEEVSVDGAGMAASAGVGAFSAALSSFTANPNVLVNDQSGAVSVDLVNMNVDNVLTLANTDAGKVLNFTGFVSDVTANTAATSDNARVIVRDAMPAIAQTAAYNGDSITVTYNEKVSLEAGDAFTLRGTVFSDTILVDQATADANQNTSTVTINLLNEDYNGGNSVVTRTVRSIDGSLYFNRGTFDNDDDPTTAPVMITSGNAVSILSAEGVKDAANGTSWSNWDGGANLLSSPAIVINNSIGGHTLTSVTPSGFTATSSEFTVTYVFNHRVDLGQICPAAGSGALTLSAAQVAGCFTWSGGAIDTSSPADDGGVVSKATITPDGKTVTVTVNMDASATLTAADTFTMNNNVQSAWDTTITTISNGQDDTTTAGVIEGTGITVP